DAVETAMEEKHGPDYDAYRVEILCTFLQLAFQAVREALSLEEKRMKAMTLRTAGLTSFPDYLVLHMRKFVMETGWVPKKLDVYVYVDDAKSCYLKKLLEAQEEPAKLLSNDDIGVLSDFNNRFRAADFYNEVNIISSVERINLVRLLDAYAQDLKAFLYMNTTQHESDRFIFGDSFRLIRNSCEEAIFQQQIQGNRFKYYVGGEVMRLPFNTQKQEQRRASEAKDLPKTNLSDQYKKDCLNISIKKEGKCPCFLEWNQARRRSVRLDE
ncbi:hypothetical protein Tco_0776932, partial [Tanacetum coccineum]